MGREDVIVPDPHGADEELKPADPSSQSPVSPRRKRGQTTGRAKVATVAPYQWSIRGVVRLQGSKLPAAQFVVNIFAPDLGGGDKLLTQAITDTKGGWAAQLHMSERAEDLLRYVREGAIGAARSDR